MNKVFFSFVVVKPQNNRKDDSQHPEPNRPGAEIGIDHQNQAERQRFPKLQLSPIPECHKANCAKEEAGDQGGGCEHMNVGTNGKTFGRGGFVSLSCFGDF